jgi:hypothetical protein
MSSQEILSARQVRAIETAERVTSVLSVLGSLFIISTFLSFKFFRKRESSAISSNAHTNPTSYQSPGLLCGVGKHHGQCCDVDIDGGHAR